MRHQEEEARATTALLETKAEQIEACQGKLASLTACLDRISSVRTSRGNWRGRNRNFCSSKQRFGQRDKDAVGGDVRNSPMCSRPCKPCGNLTAATTLIVCRALGARITRGRCWKHRRVGTGCLGMSMHLDSSTTRPTAAAFETWPRQLGNDVLALYSDVAFGSPPTFRPRYFWKPLVSHHQHRSRLPPFDHAH